jgi:peptide/nickel transport system permease protein
MTAYILRRILLTFPVLFIVTTVLFVIIRITPGDPVQIQYGIDAPPDQVAAIRQELGLDRPILIQYFGWVKDMLTGDFGHSLRSRRPVVEEIRERLPATLEMQVLAFCLSLGISVPLGAYAALKRRSIFATLTTGFSLVFISVPGFFVSTMLVFFFTYKLRIFEQPRYIPLVEDPVANLRNLILPVIALSIGAVAVYARFIRASVLEALSQDYIRTARSKGLHEWQVLTRHALRNALIPVITLFGLSVATLWTGAFITERIFNWPGVGRLATTALVNKDYPVVQAIVFLVTISYVLGNLLVDIGYAFADPRIRFVRRP